MLKHQEQIEQPTATRGYRETDSASPTETAIPTSARTEDISLPTSNHLQNATTATSGLRSSARSAQLWKIWLRTTAVIGTILSIIATVVSLLPTHTQATTSVNTSSVNTSIEPASGSGAAIDSGGWHPLTLQTASTLPRSAWVMSNMIPGVDYYISRDELYQVSHGISTFQIPVDMTRGELKPSSKQWRVSIKNTDLVVHGFSRGDAGQQLSDFTSVKVNNDQHPVEVSVQRLKDSPVRATLLDRSDAKTDSGVVETLSIPAAPTKAH